MNIRIVGYWYVVMAVAVLLPAAARGGFTDINAGLPGIRVCSAGWADIDNDGFFDLALSGHDVAGSEISRIFRNTAGDFITNTIDLSQRLEYSSLSWGDVDNDGDLDLAICGSYGFPVVDRLTQVYRNDRNAFVLISSGVLQGVNQGAISYGDGDNDGDLDLAITGMTGNQSLGTYRTSRVYRNSGGHFYTDDYTSLGKVNNSSLSWGDYDNDGDLDISLCGYDPDITSGWCRIYSNATGVFGSYFDIVSSGLWSGSLSWGDYDNDGDVDLAACGLGVSIVSPTAMSRIFRNNNGTFVDIGAGLADVGRGALSWGDYDNDGDVDLALIGAVDSSNFQTKVFHNDGTGFSDSGFAFPGLAEAAISFGDYDDDGDLDLAVAGTTSIDTTYTADEFYARIYRSDTSGTTLNAVPVQPSGCRADYDRIHGILSARWDASTDDKTDQHGLYYEIRAATEPLSDALKKWVISPSTGAGVGSAGTQRLGTYPHGYCASGQPGFNLKIPSENINTTYYWQVRSIDAVLAKSSWSTEQVIYCTSVVFLPENMIGGRVTTAGGVPITGVEVAVRAPDGSIYGPVNTSTSGVYMVTLAAATGGPYAVTASWAENNIRSSVFKDNIAGGQGSVDFSLAVAYELAEMYGQVALARRAAPGTDRAAARGSSAGGGGFVEVSQNGRVIARVPTDDQGRYTVGNLLPGRYVVRAFNGLAYSQPSVVDLREGSRLSVSFTYDLLNSDTVYAYPNPAAGVAAAVIRFETPVSTVEARIHIFTLSGELVKTVETDDIAAAGRSRQYTWDLTNNAGDTVASGVYLFQVRVKDAGTGQYETVVKKLAVVR